MNVRADTKIMKAARLHEVGGKFQVDQVGIPEPTGQDVLIRIKACGVVPNLKNVITKYPTWFPFLPLPPLPAIFGLDPAGVVTDVGKDVIGLNVGERVYVNPLRSCGTCPKCRTGKPKLCTSLAFAGYFGHTPGAVEIFNRYPWGGFAEYMIAPANSLVSLPDNISFEEAGRIGYLGTAYGALERAKVGPETSVLVNGATGTVGVGTVLIALALGAPKILAVARNRTLLERIMALAPHRIAIHSNLDGPATDWARAETGGYGPDVIIEALNPDAAVEATTDAFHAVSKGGTIVTVGGRAEPFPIDPIWLMALEISYLGSNWFTNRQANDLLRMVGSGALDLGQLSQLQFPLDKVNEALEAAQRRPSGGFESIVVTV